CKRDSVETGVQLDDLADLELGLKARGLELNADQRFGRPGVRSSVDLADQDRAGGRLEQSLDRAEGACLAGSVRTQKPEDLAFVDIERDPVHRSLGAVADAQVYDLESKTSHRRRFRGHSVDSQGITLTGTGPHSWRALTRPAQQFDDRQRVAIGLADNPLATRTLDLFHLALADALLPEAIDLGVEVRHDDGRDASAGRR